MARFVFKLPDIGEGNAEAELVAWHVAVGDVVAEDQPLIDVMTEKATVEIPSPVSGKVLARNGAPGEMITVGSDILVLETEGEEEASETEANAEPAPPPAPKEPPPLAQPLVVSTATERIDPAARASWESVATRTPGERPLASPAVRRKAWELGIPLQFVSGTGPGGRITHDDLAAYSPGRDAPAQTSRLREKRDVEEIKIIGLRRRIAERLQETKRRIPHFSYIEEVDVTAVEELRGQLNDSLGKARGRLTLLPFLVRALVRTLPDFPHLNALFDDDNGILRRHEAVHVGIATQTPSGLVVPVVRHAESLDLWGVAAELSRLAAAAREGKAAREELSGSTISITSLGRLGGLATTPVINYPEVAIIGVNKMAERPVVRGGQVVVRTMMNLSSSFDHRIVDGWDAAEFVQRLRGYLEQPATLFVE